jgi:hypothetical protein
MQRLQPDQDEEHSKHPKKLYHTEIVAAGSPDLEHLLPLVRVVRMVLQEKPAKS